MAASPVSADQEEDGSPHAEGGAISKPIRPGVTVEQVRDRLRHAILSGELPPGTPLSAVQLANSYGVSRTPVREAIRLLQEQGLLISEGNRRPRVATITPDELEGLYAQRIMLYSLSTMLTVPLLSDDDLNQMHWLYAEMVDAAEQDDVLRWGTADRAFHDTHTMHAHPTLRADMVRMHARCQYFQTLWFYDEPHRNLSSRNDHHLILEHCQSRQAVAAAHAAATHLARVSLVMMSHVAPERDQLTVRTALAIATSLPADGDRTTTGHRANGRTRPDAVKKLPAARRELTVPSSD